MRKLNIALFSFETNYQYICYKLYCICTVHKNKQFPKRVPILYTRLESNITDQSTAILRACLLMALVCIGKE
jgi:hypothetical protein